MRNIGFVVAAILLTLIGFYQFSAPIAPLETEQDKSVLADEYLSLFGTNGWFSFYTDNYYSPHQIKINYPQFNTEQATRFGEIYTQEVQRFDADVRAFRKQALIDTYTAEELRALIRANRDPDYASAAVKQEQFADQFFRDTKDFYRKAQENTLARAQQEGFPF